MTCSLSSTFNKATADKPKVIQLTQKQIFIRERINDLEKVIHKYIYRAHVLIELLNAIYRFSTFQQMLNYFRWSTYQGGKETNILSPSPLKNVFYLVFDPHSE